MPERPDVAKERAEISASLTRAGMNEIEIPVHVRLDSGKITHTLGRAFAHVNLSNPQAKGIHMSRLYLELQSHLAKHAVSFEALDQVTQGFLESHSDISDCAYAGVKFSLPLERPALSSQFKGWRYYDVEYSTSKNKRTSESLHQVGLKVLYSSTCPCSAALARQLIQEKFIEDFKNKKNVDIDVVVQWLGLPTSILATPHGQRSEAKIFLQMDGDQIKSFSIESLIDGIEKTLGTPVQAAVKREDEQEFARLNGMNLMFAEDAAKKMKRFISDSTQCIGYSLEAHHIESLHPHDAFASASYNFQSLEL